jgi:shikimate dehydrogenase
MVPHLAEGRSVLVGLVGAGIAASRTPRLHEREGAEQGLRYVYRLIDLDVLKLGTEALADILTAAQRFGFAGLNITHPCKQTVIPFLDELSPEAAALGAVNTVVLEDGRRVGHNTDRSGFAASFQRELSDVNRTNVVQFGAGGGGAAVADALLGLGVSRLSLIDTQAERAEQLAGVMCARFGAGRVVANPDMAAAMKSADGVINATPQGMARYPGTPFPAPLLRPELWVADIVYFPLETALLREARARGCRTMSGGGMAVLQAADAFRLFTGLEPDSERMMRHFAGMGG